MTPRLTRCLRDFVNMIRLSEVAAHDAGASGERAVEDSLHGSDRPAIGAHVFVFAAYLGVSLVYLSRIAPEILGMPIRDPPSAADRLRRPPRQNDVPYGRGDRPAERLRHGGDLLPVVPKRPRHDTGGISGG